MRPLQAPQRKMTSDEFIEWAIEHDVRAELIDGEVVMMAPERSVHLEVKAEAWLALRRAIEAAGLRCRAYPDGAAVVVDDATTYEPDAMVRCGEPVEADHLRFTDPVIVVEVLSPSTRHHDVGGKLRGYFRIASLQHYLILDPDKRLVVHHRREGDGTFARVLSEGELELDPPGLVVPVRAMFP